MPLLPFLSLEMLLISQVLLQRPPRVPFPQNPSLHPAKCSAGLVFLGITNIKDVRWETLLCASVSPPTNEDTGSNTFLEWFQALHELTRVKPLVPDIKQVLAVC